MKTETEFDQWISYHAALFGSGFRAWLCPGDGNSETERQEREDRLAFWYEQLYDYDLDECKAATAALRSRKIDSGAYAPQITALVDILKDRRFEQRSEPEDVTRYARRCGLCEQTGMVEVSWSSGNKAKTEGGNDIATFMVACACEKGKKYREGTNPKTGEYIWRTYNGSTMRPVQKPTLDELVEKNEATLARLREEGRDAEANVFEMVMRGKANPAALIGGRVD